MPKLRVEIDPSIDPLADELIALWVDVSNAGGAVGFVPPVSETDVSPIAEEAFAKASGDWSHLLVAFEEERAVGFCFLEYRPGPLFRHWATIKRLQIHPSLQGRGYGRAFLDRVEQVATQRLGLEQIHLTVRGGTGTEAFYLGAGYEEVARIPGLIRVAPGDDRDEIYLIKHLTS